MKYLIFVLIILTSFSAFAQDDIAVKTDGTTKYYIQVYDGETNEKVLYNNASHAGWQTKLQLADFFDGSDAQLWSFKATEMFPGYFSVINHDPTLPETAFLMSWNWNAYMGSNRDPADSKEMQYRFVEVTDGWYKFEAIEKEDGFEGLPYTPGADALNIKPEGYASFSDVKSADITADNMINKAFKLVEFNPVALFEESIIRGDDLYKDNPNAPTAAAYKLFYTLEKARELRVFGTDGEMLAYQSTIDSIVGGFNKTIGFVSAIGDARTFIEAADVDQDIKTAFNDVVSDAESVLSDDDTSGDVMDSLQMRIENAQNVVDAILEAQTYNASLTEADSLLSSGVINSIGIVKLVLADSESGAEEYSMAVSHLTRTQELIDQIKEAEETILATQEFEEAKGILGAAIEDVVVTLNMDNTSVSDLDLALLNIKSAVKAFMKALEAGDTPVELRNADFEDGLTDWEVQSPTPGSAYPENKGVDGSKSITFWKGTEYQMMVSQTIADIPNGVYQISCFAMVNADSTIALFGESGANSTVLPLVGNELTKRVIEVEVTDGTLMFGIKGYGENNTIPGGRWVVFDEFEVKWKSNFPVLNSDFEDGLSQWTVEGETSAAYPENKGVDGSRSITTWKGTEYNISVSQTISGLVNGIYAVSAMAKTNLDSAFVVFGESGSVISSEPVSGADLVKVKTLIEVVDGTLTFGVKGAGVDNLVPAGRWIVFDDVEVVRTADLIVSNFDFADGLNNWLVEGETSAAYPENKGIDGSKSITTWKGTEYSISVSQTMTGLPNGTYAVSAMAKTNLDSAFVVFGESASMVSIKEISGNQFAKSEVLASVSDGSLKFGVKGAGDNNLVPAGRWVVFDNVEVKIKTITPEYMVSPKTFEVTAISAFKENLAIKTWCANNSLNVLASKEIVNYTVYGMTGAIVKKGKTNSKDLSIPLQKGVYLINVTMIDGENEVSKVLIR